MPPAPSEPSHRPAGEPPSGPGSRLRELAALAAEVGAEPTAGEARSFAERLADRRVYVACVGQFKRGKSTLLNALAGEPVLPTGVAPVTSVITVIRGGERRARIRTGEGEWRDVDPGTLDGYVTEEGNPSNEKGVSGVEVFLPSPLLARGLCLVDTPGLGSVFSLAGETTRAFVPHIDAALVVLGGDPPITGEEVALVQTLSDQIDDLLFVLNKADKLSDTERDQARRFTERVLEDRLGRSPEPVLEVSANERLAGQGPPRDWEKLKAGLQALGAASDGPLVRAAESRALRFLGGRLLHELSQRDEALARPLEETDRMIRELRTCAVEASRSLGDLSHLLEAHQDRLRAGFAERRRAFLARALPSARAELAHRLRSAPERTGPSLRRRGFSLAREIDRRWVAEWKETEEPVGDAMYRDGARRFVEVADAFLARLASAGVPAPTVLVDPPGEELGLRVRSRFHATEMMTFASRSPLGLIVDLLLPRPLALPLIERSAGAYLARLLVTNAARVTGDLDERVRESRRLLEAEVRARLGEVVGSAERAREAALERTAAGRPAVEAEAARIAAWRRRLAALLAPERTE